MNKNGYQRSLDYLYGLEKFGRIFGLTKVNEKEIEKEEVASLTEWMRERIETAGVAPPFTFFDFTTAMAFLYFKQKMVDLAVLEVGLGGRLDSTNVIDPLVP